MRGNPEVIRELNAALTAELSAIVQYMVQSEMCENWGYRALKKVIWDESIGEMKHAEELMERILYLDGTPNMSELFPIRIGQNVKQMMESDLALEIEAVARYNASIQLCREVGDNGSRELFEELLADEGSEDDDAPALLLVQVVVEAPLGEREVADRGELRQRQPLRHLTPQRLGKGCEKTRRVVGGRRQMAPLRREPPDRGQAQGQVAVGDVQQRPFDETPLDEPVEHGDGRLQVRLFDRLHQIAVEAGQVDVGSRMFAMRHFCISLTREIASDE